MLLKFLRRKDKSENLSEPTDKNYFILSLFEKISQKCSCGDAIDSLNYAERIFYICQTAEAELNNGGFLQFYYNSSGSLCYEAPHAFIKIKAVFTGALFQKANAAVTDALYKLSGSEEDCRLPQNSAERAEILKKIDTDELAEELNSFDNEFYKYTDNLTELCYNYVIYNKNCFIEHFLSVYSCKDILSFNRKGIALKNGEFIDFKVCTRKFESSYGKSSFKCVAERNIDANPPYFEFYTPHRVRIIFNSGKPFTQENKKLFRQFREKLESYSYTSFDLT